MNINLINSILDFAPSIIVSILTAVVTVLLTFYERNKNERESTLEALMTELHQNDIHTEMIAHDLFQFRNGIEESDNMRTTLPLQTSAYELTKNSGALATLEPVNRESINYHYTLIRSLNRKIEQRENIQYNIGSVESNGMIKQIDESILHGVIDICDPRRLEVIAVNLRENNQVESEFEDAAESQPDERDIGEDSPRQTYDGVLEMVEWEIERGKIWSKLSNWLSELDWKIK